MRRHNICFFQRINKVSIINFQIPTDLSSKCNSHLMYLQILTLSGPCNSVGLDWSLLSLLNPIFISVSSHYSLIGSP